MKISRAITDVNLTADQWELFGGAGAEACAKRLNAKFMELVNSGATREQVWIGMDRFMSAPAQNKYGACDSEPQYHMERLIKKVFGE